MTSGIGLPPNDSGSAGSNVSYFSEEKKRREEQPPSGGGDPPDMKDRIDKLEAGHATVIEKLNDISASLKVIDAKLDAKADKAGVASLEGRVVSVKDAIDTRASQSELNLLKGSVASLPTTTQLIIFAIAIFTAAGITRLFGH